MGLAKHFYELFAGLRRAYGTYEVDPELKGIKKKGKALTLAEELTVKVWEGHIKGKQGIGVVPIRDDDTCVWGALDIDKYDLDLVALENQINEIGLPLVLCRTKSGGAHLYMFTSEPVPAALIREKLERCGDALGYPDTEIFPKQVTMGGPKDIGNWINMPYFDAAATNRYAIEDGEPVPAERFLEMAEERKMSLGDLELLDPQVQEEPFSDGPPCLEHLAKVGFPAGSMNHALFNVGVYYRNRYADGWEDKVQEANQRWMGPGTFQEVSSIIKSLNRKGYQYKCSDQPLVGHCKRSVCAKRDYGIPTPAKNKAAAKEKRECILDRVDKPVVCFEPPAGSGDEPRWGFKIQGQELTLTMDIIFNQRKFLMEYFKHFHQIELPTSEERWARKMNELLASEEREEMPADAGPEGQLWAHVESFCTGKVQAQEREEILLARPWTDEGITYFRSGDLIKYLEQAHFRVFNSTEIHMILRQRGAGHKQFNIKGRCTQCWWVPAFGQQTEGFNPIEIPVQEDKF
jgi:hypothetical protein